jgi:hypothetical protein
MCLPGALWADNLTWGGTYIADWDGFGTSPYTATDTSLTPHQGMQIFCLDFNDSIAPPTDWTASIMTLNQPNVAGTGAYAGVYAAQYGGDYNNLLTAAFNNPANPRPASEKTVPQVSGQATGVVPPYAFNSDNAGGGYSIDLSPSNNPTPSRAAYLRYLEAAWLFTDTLAALPGDRNTDIIAQVAAWELFVNNSNLSLLTGDVDKYAGSFVFNNYLALAPGQTYTTTSVVHTQSTPTTGDITFRQAVDAALAEAQTAVITNGWGPGSNNYGSWSLVTGTPDYVIGYGQPVQEFLSPNAPDPPDPPLDPLSAVPEPKAVLLLATAAAVALWAAHKKRPA